MNDEELKLQIVAQLDVLEFLDLISMDFAEVVDILFEDLDEESKQELARAVG